MTSLIIVVVSLNKKLLAEEPAAPEEPPAPTFGPWAIESTVDISGAEGAAGSGSVTVAGGDPAAPPTFSAEGVTVSGECPTWTLTKEWI